MMTYYCRLAVLVTCRRQCSNESRDLEKGKRTRREKENCLPWEEHKVGRYEARRGEVN